MLDIKKTHIHNLERKTMIQWWMKTCAAVPGPREMQRCNKTSDVDSSRMNREKTGWMCRCLDEKSQIWEAAVHGGDGKWSWSNELEREQQGWCISVGLSACYHHLGSLWDLLLNDYLNHSVANKSLRHFCSDNLLKWTSKIQTTRRFHDLLSPLPGFLWGMSWYLHFHNNSDIIEWYWYGYHVSNTCDNIILIIQERCSAICLTLISWLSYFLLHYTIDTSL